MKRKFGLRKFGKTDRQRAVRALDIAFSKMIRERDGGICITCNKKFEGSMYHAGHFMRRELMSTRWHPKNVNGQCAGDNVFRGGLRYEYGLALDKKYGAGTAKEMYDLAKTTKLWDVKYLLALVEAAKMGIRVYVQLYDELK